MSTRFKCVIILLLLAFASPGLSIAGITPRTYTVSPFVGGYVFDGDQSLKDRPVYGLRLGHDCTKNWAGELVFDYVNTRYKKHDDASTNVYNYRLDTLYHFMPDSKLVPYIAAGIGGMSIDYKSSEGNTTKPTFNYGVGLKYFITEMAALRLDVRHVLVFGSIDNNLEYTAGLTFLFGKGKAPTAAPPLALEPTPPPMELKTPVDSDGDGVPDDIDKCPNTPKGVKVDKDGCPIDSDGDGVPDYLDKCPNTPKGVEVDKDGCPIDSDGDGVPDYLDKCPNTPKGVKVDKDGCPIPQKVCVRLKVEFDFDKADIKPEYHEELASVAKIMKQHPVSVVLEGHTDSIGSEKYNLKLSQRRADSVRNYLIEKLGIESSQLTAKGYGKSRPIADNSTPEGRQENRRVEAVIEYMPNK